MVKSIIKEIFIIMLLIIAILLVLGIIFYEYSPTDKKVPSKVESYGLSQEMQEELNETLVESETRNLILPLSVSASDLKGYEKTRDYDKGKINPFDRVNSTGTRNNQTSSGGTNGEISNGESSGNTGTGGSSNSSSSSGQGKFGVDGNK